jgi:hypothetical protein
VRTDTGTGNTGNGKAIRDLNINPEKDFPKIAAF